MPSRNAVTFSGNRARASPTGARSTVRACRESPRRAGPIPRPSLAGQSEGREPGRVENLVRVRVPTPLTMRGSVNARFRVRFSRLSAARKHARSAVRTSMPPGSMASRPGSPATTWSDALRLAPASVRVSEPGGKSKAARFWRPFEGRVARLPMQAAGDHRAQHQPEVAIQANGDALSHSPQFAHSSSRGFRERRRRGSKKKRAYKPHAFERQPHHARFQRSNVSRDVRQFGHTSPACTAPAGLARPVGGRTKGQVPNPPRLRVRAADSRATAALTRTPKPRAHIRWVRHCRNEAHLSVLNRCTAPMVRCLQLDRPAQTQPQLSNIALLTADPRTFSYIYLVLGREWHLASVCPTAHFRSSPSPTSWPSAVSIASTSLPKSWIEVIRLSTSFRFEITAIWSPMRSRAGLALTTATKPFR